jgi:hypothetical protein
MLFMAKKKITRGVSFPSEERLFAAIDRAGALDVSLSKYINLLIASDLKDKKPIVLEESAPYVTTRPSTHARRHTRD